MLTHQLAQDIMTWQAQDSQLLSIKPKSKEKTSDKTLEYKRYYILEDNKELYFTYREMELLMFLAQPYTYKSIGAKLGLSDRTIECHVRRMRIKIHCIDRYELIDKVMGLAQVQRFKTDYFFDAGGTSSKC